MQSPCAAYILQFSFGSHQTFIDEPSIGLDLGFAWAAEETESTTLPPEMCP